MDIVCFKCVNKVKRSFKFLDWCTLFFLVCFIHVNGLTQLVHELNFQNMDYQTQLSNSQVNDLCQDSLGFMWIATNDGLIRYDAPSIIQVYKKGDLGLESDLIKTLFCASDGTLWIGSTFGGLTRYHPETFDHKTYLFDPSQSNTISSSEILCIQEVTPGEFWIGTENGLDVLYPELDSVYNFNEDAALENSRIPGAILSINVDQKGWIWVSTWDKGLYLYLPHISGDHSKGVFKKIENTKIGDQINVWELKESNAGIYWLATHKSGLACMDLPDVSLDELANTDWHPRFKFFSTVYESKYSLALEYTKDIEFDDEGNLWIATAAGGSILSNKEIKSIDWLDQDETLKFISFFSKPNSRASINDNNIISLQKDDQGHIWIGTATGVNQFNQLNNRFTRYTIDGFTNPYSNIKDRINDIKIISDTSLVFATNSNHMIYFNYERNEIINDLPYLRHEDEINISSLFKNESNNLYVGSNTGVRRMSLKPPFESRMYKLESSLIDSNDDEVWNEGKTRFYIRAILIDSKNRCWVSTEANVFILNEKTGRWRPVVTHEGANRIIEDSQGNIWMSTYRGVIKVDSDKDIDDYEIFLRGRGDDNEAISSNSVYGIFEYDNNIYFGSEKGIFSYNLKTHKFETQPAIKFESSINDLLITSEGVLWALASNGILKYDINSRTYNFFGKDDGLELNKNRGNACVEAPNGDIILGALAGFLRINATDENFKANNKLPVFINMISLNGDAIVNESLLNADQVIVPPNNKSVTINFTNLNYSRPEKNSFAYRLQGFENEWNYTKTNNVIYTNLEPGEYEFQLKSKNDDGPWTSDFANMTLLVEPTLIEKTVSKILMAILSILLIGFFIRLYFRYLRKRNAILREYNEKLEQREEEMKILLSQLDRSNKDLKESNNSLEQFAFIASHDLQEPLRTIGTYAQLLDLKTQKNNDPEIEELTNFMTQGVKRMSSMIHAILNYSMLGKNGDEFKHVNLQSLVEGKVQDLNDYVKRRNAKIEFNDLPSITCRPEQIATVFYNLILNGLKFNKNEVPKVSIRHQEFEDYWEFRVKDNGIGIAVQHQKKIFDIFKRLNNKDEFEGTGIGLAMCDKIIRSHGGKISLISKIGLGSEFVFTVKKSDSRNE